MKSTFRVTEASLAVLGVLADADGELYGRAVAAAAQRPTGTVYPMLARWENAGWVEGRWEIEHPQPGRPRRRFYKLTDDGRAISNDLLKDGARVKTVPTQWIEGPDGVLSVRTLGPQEHVVWNDDADGDPVQFRSDHKREAIGWAKCKVGITAAG